MSELPTRGVLAGLLTEHTCTRNCFGIRGQAASCCKLGARDFIQGPVRDAAEVLRRLSARFGRAVQFKELFVEFEEGSSLFADRPRWQQPENFPALRPLADEARGFPCQFLTSDGRCGIYEDRPQMCANYRCQHLASVLAPL